MPLVIPQPVLKGSKALVVSIANDSSIAYGCARALRELGADLALTYQNVNIGQLLSGLRKSLAQPNEVSGSATELGGQSWARVSWPRAAGRWSSWSAAGLSACTSAEAGTTRKASSARPN